jgi:hypothetical protein
VFIAEPFRLCGKESSATPKEGVAVKKTEAISLQHPAALLTTSAFRD